MSKPNTQLIVVESGGARTVGESAGMSKNARKRANRRARLALAEGALVRVKGQARKARRQRAQTSLSRENPYLATILDPEEVRGIKVPDPITMPSSTYTYELDSGVTVDSAGQFICVVNPANIVNSSAPTNAPANDVVVVSQGGTNTGFGTATVPLQGANANPAVSGMIGSIRIVSGMVRAYAAASPLNTTGRMIGFAIPRGFQQILSNYTAVMALPYSFADHAAKGGCSRYIPTDNVERQYVQVGGTSVLNGNTITTGSWAGASSSSGCFGIAGYGLPPGVVFLRIVINYEFLPASDAADFINRDVSPDRPDWLNQVNTFIQKWGERLVEPVGNLLGLATDIVLPGARQFAGAALRAAMPSLTGSFGTLNIGSRSPSKYGRLPY